LPLRSQAAFVFLGLSLFLHDVLSSPIVSARLSRLSAYAARFAIVAGMLSQNVIIVVVASRLRCPRYGSRNIIVLFQPPTNVAVASRRF
jgi:hypothetical protein